MCTVRSVERSVVSVLIAVKTGERRGINVARAQKGYRELIEWNRSVAGGEHLEDGVFVTFWRLLLEYPEILAWQRLWTDGAEQFMKMIYGNAKAVRPDIQIGWHLYHNFSLSPFCRASSDYARWAEFSDFLKVVVYNATGGARMKAWVERSCRALLADSAPETVYPFLLDMMGYKEVALGDLISKGLSADYVEREVRRAVNGVAGACAV